MRTLFASALVALMAVPCAVLAQGIDDNWQAYVDRDYGFSAQVPVGVFTPVNNPSRPGLSLEEMGGEAKLSLYGGPARGMTRDALEARLESGENISTITYRAGGASWFVLSGFYQPELTGEQTIFYTKVLFSPDRESFSAFEISFPERDKPRFEQMVEYFEDHFTRPAR